MEFRTASHVLSLYTRMRGLFQSSTFAAMETTLDAENIGHVTKSILEQEPLVSKEFNR